MTSSSLFIIRSLKCIQEKWAPVFRPNGRPNKDLERFRESVTFGNALAVVALIAGLTFSTPLAWSQTADMQALNHKLERLERDLQDVQRELYSNYSRRNTGSQIPAAPADSTATARLSVRLTELEESISHLTGQIEQLGFRVGQVERNLQVLARDANFRLGVAEQALGISNLSTAGQAPGVAPFDSSVPMVTSVPRPSDVTIGSQSYNTTVQTAGAPQTLGTLPVGQLPGTAGELYETAKSRLMAGDFAGAESAFSKFLEEYGDDQLAGEAQYWLGEAFYVRGAYRQAGQAFADGLAKYPSNPRGADTLLKLGMSLAALQETDAACTTFSELDRRFPGASQAIVQRVTVEKSKAGCG